MSVIVEAACGAVSHTYTTQIGENRQEIVYLADMHPSMNESLGWSACMYVKRVFFFIVDLLLVSLWNLRATAGFVPCLMVSRSIVVHWDGAWSASHPRSVNMTCLW